MAAAVPVKLAVVPVMVPVGRGQCVAADVVNRQVRGRRHAARDGQVSVAQQGIAGWGDKQAEHDDGAVVDRHKVVVLVEFLDRDGRADRLSDDGVGRRLAKVQADRRRPA